MCVCVRRGRGCVGKVGGGINGSRINYLRTQDVIASLFCDQLPHTVVIISVKAHDGSN